MKKIISLLIAICMLLVYIPGVFAWERADNADDDNIVRIGVLSDVHSGISGLQSAVNAFYAIDPSLDGLVFAGDIIYMTDTVNPSLYDSLLNASVGASGNSTTIAQLMSDKKISYAMGNHEIPLQGDEAAGAESIKAFTDKTGLDANNVVTLGGYSVISVSPYNYDGQFSDDTAEYLKEEIDKALLTDDNSPVFINIHFGFKNTCLGTSGSDAAEFSDAKAELIETIKSNPRIITLSGHKHYAEQDPRTIYQQPNGFTAIQTSHVANGNSINDPKIDVRPEKTEDNMISQCLLLEINKTTNVVSIHRIDVKNGRKIGSVYTINVPEMVAGNSEAYKYTTEAREAAAACPGFVSDAAVSVDASENEAEITFCRATRFSEDEVNYAHYYDVEIIDAKTNETYIKQRYLADFYKAAQAENITVNIKGLQADTSYIAKVTALSAYLKASDSIFAEFKTTDSEFKEKPMIYIQEKKASEVTESSFGDFTIGQNPTWAETCFLLSNTQYMIFDFEIAEGKEGMYRVIPVLGSAGAGAKVTVSGPSIEAQSFERGIYTQKYDNTKEYIWGEYGFNKAGTYTVKIERTTNSGTSSLNVSKLKIGCVGEIDPAIIGYNIDHDIDKLLEFNPEYQSGCIKTADTEIDPGKTYYTISKGTIKAVESPTVGNLSKYYEKVSEPGKFWGSNYYYDSSLKCWGVSAGTKITTQITPEYSGMYDISANFGSKGAEATITLSETRTLKKVSTSDNTQTMEKDFIFSLGDFKAVSATGTTWTENLEYQSFGVVPLSKGKTYTITFNHSGKSVAMKNIKATCIKFDPESHQIKETRYAGDYVSTTAATKSMYGYGTGNLGYGINKGEIVFNFDIPVRASYDAVVCAGASKDSAITLTIDGDKVINAGSVNTGNFEAIAETKVAEGVMLDAGTHTVKVYSAGSIQFCSLTFVSTGEYDVRELAVLAKNRMASSTVPDNKFETAYGVTAALLNNTSVFVEYEIDIDAGNYEIWLQNGVYTNDKWTCVIPSVNGIDLPQHRLDYNGDYYAAEESNAECVGIAQLKEGKNVIRFRKGDEGTASYFSMSKFTLKALDKPTTELYNAETAANDSKTEEISDGTVTAKAYLPKDAKGKNMSVIFAIYKNGTELYKMNYETITATRNGAAEVTIEDIKKEEGATYSYKVFYWDNLNTIKPLY